jgi:enoyl-CoA hydratase/carnithine racemase
VAEPAVLVEARDHTLFMTLNRPDKMNAQNEEMRELLVGAIDRLERDPALLVGIVYGAGGRAFSAGADIGEGQSLREAELAAAESEGLPPRPLPLPEHQRAGWRHFEAFRWCSKPLIAAIDGYCLGGGLELANYCDIRLATEASLLGQPEPRTIGGGVRPGTHQLVRAVPMGEAMLTLLTAQPMTAKRAYDVGLIQRLCPDVESLLAEAKAIADQMAECDPDALATIKRVVRWGGDMSAEQAEVLGLLANEAAARARATGTRWQPPARR